jgi:hypothetical protein
MKKLSFILLSLLFANVLLAQTDSVQAPKVHPVKHSLQAGMNINQSSFSDNWNAGSLNSFAFGWYANYLVKYKNNNWDFNSDLQLQLGYVDNQGETRKKNADRIFYDAKAGYILSKHWNAFGSLNFLSQFSDGYSKDLKSVLEPSKDSLISRFMSPAYLTSSVGLEYKPLSYIWMRFGIGTLRQTFVLDEKISQAQLYGLENPGDKLRNQFVLQYIFNFDKDLNKNVNFKTRYTVNYDYFKSGKPNAFVHLFNANLSLKATKYLSTNFQVNIIKDYDQSHDIQWSQVLSIGLVYSISRD